MISIHILCFSFFQDPRAYRKFTIVDLEGFTEQYTIDINLIKNDLVIDFMELHFLELSKKLLHNMNHKLQLWFEFLKDPKETLMTHRIEIENDAALKKAFAALEQFSRDPEMRAIYEAEIKQIRDHNSSIRTGIEEGRKEGKDETERAIALNLLSLGVHPSLIAQSANRDEAWVLSLRDEAK